MPFGEKETCILRANRRQSQTRKNITTVMLRSKSQRDATKSHSRKLRSNWLNELRSATTPPVIKCHCVDIFICARRFTSVVLRVCSITFIDSFMNAVPIKTWEKLSEKRIVKIKKAQIHIAFWIFYHCEAYAWLNDKIILCTLCKTHTDISIVQLLFSTLTWTID